MKLGVGVFFFRVKVTKVFNVFLRGRQEEVGPLSLLVTIDFRLQPINQVKRRKDVFVAVVVMVFYLVVVMILLVAFILEVVVVVTDGDVSGGGDAWWEC